MPHPRLKTYLLVSLTLATVTPLVCLGAVEVVRWREVQRRDADSELVFTAEALARSIGQSVDANVRALETSAGELEAHQSFEPSVLQSIVEIHRRRFPGLALVNIAGPDGRTLASDPIYDAKRGSYIGRDYADRAYYRDMVRTGRTGISEVEIGKVSGKPAIHAKTPIRALDGPRAGQLIGSMGFGLALDHLQKLTAQVTSTFAEIEARVIDNRARVITESDPAGHAVLRDLSAVDLYRGAPGTGVDLRDGVDEHGASVRAAVARIPEQSLNWTVAVTRSKVSIEARAGHARRTVFIALAAALLGGLLIAFALSSWLARPIINLETYAATVRAGQQAAPPLVAHWNPREVTTLIDTVESMVRELRARNQDLQGWQETLEVRIRDRTAELDQRTTQMRLLLDNLTDGVFTMDRRGAISAEYSQVLVTWFGAPGADEPFFRYFGRQSVSFGQHAELGWEQVTDDLLGLEVALGQLPRHMETSGRHYNFSYRPIGDSEGRGDGGFLVVVTDVTSEIERETIVREKRETLTLFEHMLGDRAGFLTFLDEASATVARLGAPEASDANLRRDVHTLKGNSLSFGIQSVGSLCHEIETGLLEGGSAWREQVIQLRERWARLTADVERLLGNRRRVVEISPEQHAQIERAGREGASRESLLQMFHELARDPIERRLQRFATQAYEMAGRLDKQVVIELEHDDLRVDASAWAPFWAAFVHALRNAVDHGIESEAERLAAGKPSAGRIVLRARRELSTGVIIEIEDDGRGIDWDAVRSKATARGLRVGSEDDLTELLFEDGVSTTRQVTQLSGRGIGMGALRAEVWNLGGKISVHSTRGAGTRLRMTFPPDGAPGRPAVQGNAFT